MGGGIWRIGNDEEGRKALKGLFISLFILFFIMVVGFTLAGIWTHVTIPPLAELIKIIAIILLLIILLFLIYLKVSE